MDDLSDGRLAELVKRAEGIAGKGVGADRNSDFSRGIVSGVLLSFMVADARKERQESESDELHDGPSDSVGGPTWTATQRPLTVPGDSSDQRLDEARSILMVRSIRAYCDGVSDHSTKRELLDAIIAIASELPAVEIPNDRTGQGS